MLWKDLIQSEYFKIALGLDMDTHIVKNETIKIRMSFTLHFGRAFSSFPSKEHSADIMDDTYWMRKEPLIVS